jgi:dihydroorotate dehydrogenase (NAD+) catalytic subunit
MMKLEVKIGNVTFKNPVWVASGTFGYGKDLEEFLDLGDIGAIVTKTVTKAPREGNPPPRIVETPSGLLNSIGLENKGIGHFKKECLPFLKKIKTRVIVSIAGDNKEEFVYCAGELAGRDRPDAIEINLSCPNVSHGATKYSLLAQDTGLTESITRAVRENTKCAIIAKLTPNVTDITEAAKAAEAGGADAVSLVNTYFAMAVDAEERKPLIGNVTGGLSGPAIKPMALKAVWDVYNAVKIPVVGIGGIMRGTDVAEFMLCGARAVQLGTANFVDPTGHKRVLKEFTAYLKRQRISGLDELVGRLHI